MCWISFGNFDWQILVKRKVLSLLYNFSGLIAQKKPTQAVLNHLQVTFFVLNIFNIFKIFIFYL